MTQSSGFTSYYCKYYVLDSARDSIEVLSNSEHPENGRLRPKHVAA
jgi:hypothetical protein